MQVTTVVSVGKQCLLVQDSSQHRLGDIRMDPSRNSALSTPDAQIAFGSNVLSATEILEQILHELCMFLQIASSTFSTCMADGT